LKSRQTDDGPLSGVEFIFGRFPPRSRPLTLSDLRRVVVAASYRNKQGQTRFSSYYEWISMEERSALESEIIRKCLSRSELQCSFLEYRGYKVIYRRYASLFFIAGTKPDGDDTENSENELGMLEFIHTLVETMDKWAGSICGTCPGSMNCLRRRDSGFVALTFKDLFRLCTRVLPVQN
jgi:Clathrin adaptor complex small chain